MKLNFSKIVDNLPIFESVPDYDIMSPVETATEEEIANGFAFPVSVTMGIIISSIEMPPCWKVSR